jgi:peptidoglycan/xylan/chitin deacetylase (PgdA/CDA1 family)
MLRFDRLATLYLSLPLTRVFGPSSRTHVPILMYHSISENLFGRSHPYYQINTPPKLFEQQIRWMRQAGYRGLGLTDMLDALKAGDDLSQAVVLTFDDGYRDFFTDAFPVIKQCGFTATVFLATDRIANKPMRIEGVEYLTWREVRELHSQGIDFGSHTVTHADLRSLTTDQIDFELGCSKETIEQNTGTLVASFAYPFAFPEEDSDFTRYLVDMLDNHGFENGVSTIIGRATRESHQFFLPRLPVNLWDDLHLLQAKLEGGYDWLHRPQRWYKALTHNASLMQRIRSIET